MRDVEADRAGSRTLADHDVEEEVLHRGIEHLFDLVVEAVDLVHEQDVTLLEIGEDGREVARALDGRARRGVQARTHLVGDDACERGLAKTRGAREDHMVKRLVAVARGLDEHTEVLTHALLAAIVVERLGAQRALDV